MNEPSPIKTSRFHAFSCRLGRHSREGWSPERKQKDWIPAFAGMTEGNAGMTEKSVFAFYGTVFFEE
jgi:hypothetical protein